MKEHSALLKALWQNTENTESILSIMFINRAKAFYRDAEMKEKPTTMTAL